MKITALVENHSSGELKPKHGLALYIETKSHRILFDLGPDETLFENAKKKGIDLQKVDTVIISHGHSDHGGALKRFLRLNPHADIYIQKAAFEKYYSKMLFFRVGIGLQIRPEEYPNIKLLEGDCRIDEELFLFTVSKRDKCYSEANDCLYKENGKDDFLHEQNLIIFDKTNVLIMGCGHTGVVNILERAKEFSPQLCIGGYHLFNPFTKKTVREEILEGIAGELKKYDMIFYTCHCTGGKAFAYLNEHVPEMHYFSCGEEIEV